MQPGQLTIVCDKDAARADRLIKAVGSGRAVTDVDEAIRHPEVDAIIVATPNSYLAPIASRGIRAGKHVLIEKPGAVSTSQITELLQLAEGSKSCVRVGYNHRYHPAMQKAHELIAAGAIGPLMFIRGRYGHGGRVGYEQEWRADRAISGGGELIDQGVHLIDLGQLVSRRRFYFRARSHKNLLLEYACGRQRLPEPANCGRADRMAACKLHGVEKHVLVRNLWAHWQTAH